MAIQPRRTALRRAAIILQGALDAGWPNDDEFISKREAPFVQAEMRRIIADLTKRSNAQPDLGHRPIKETVQVWR